MTIRQNTYKNRHRKAVKIAAFAVLLSTTALHAPAQANPQGGQVVGGAASIHETGKKLDVHQQSHRAVIDWQRFDIDVDEHTQFYQPSSTSIILNRVKSADPSRILGKLIANGNVVLSNPSGVFFGRDAVVDVNGLVATSADIATDTFMGGGNEFNIPGHPNAAIVNTGTITAKKAGLVGLVAPNVINSGVIEARLGRVQLAAGDTPVIDFYGDGLLKVALKSDRVTSQLAANTGTLRADGGTVAMSAAKAGDLVNSLVSAAGELKAPSVDQKQGRIIIRDASDDGNVNVRANLDASGRNTGEQGGSIAVLGDHIAILDGTVIDASGHSAPVPPTKPDFANAGSASLSADKKVRTEAEFLAHDNRAGGSIKIGGDYLGIGDTPTAKTLYVGANTLTLNDAIKSGDAGRTIFWSDDTTDFNGLVFARGGVKGGHGGFLETSGKINLAANGLADLTARANGYNKGTYLLDPANITIFGNENSAFTDLSLAGYWDFEGDANDSSGNGNNGTINGATFTGSGAPTPQHNTNSLAFDGVNDFVETGPDSIISGSQPWTISYWANINSSESGGGRQGWPIWKGPSNQSTDRLIGISVSGGNIEVANWGNDFTFSAPIDFDAWQNVIVTYDGTSAQNVYLNGQFTDSRNAGGLNINQDSWFFGGRPGRKFIKGQIDDVRIYNSALSDNKISELNGSRFTVAGLEHMSQTADIDLQASNSITLDLQGDMLALADDRSLSMSTTNGNVTDVSGGTIRTNQTGTGGNISIIAGGSGNIDLDQTNLEATNGGFVNLEATGNIDLVQASDLHLGNVEANSVTIESTAGAIDGNGSIIATTGGINLTASDDLDTRSLALLTFDQNITLSGDNANLGTALHAGTGAVNVSADQDITLSQTLITLPAGLVAQWALDDGGGTNPLESVGGGNDATFLGNPVWSADTPFGLGNSLAFDGSSDSVNTNFSVDYTPGDAFTYSVWAKTGTPADRADILDIRDFSETNNPVILITHNFNDTGNVAGIARGSDGLFDEANSGDIGFNNNAWNHVALTVDNGNGRLFVNGESLDTFSGLDMNINLAASSLFFGSTEGTDRLFNGNIDDVRVYNAALNSDDIRKLSSPMSFIESWQSGSTTFNAGRDVTLNEQVTATAAGDALTIVSGRNFINNHGAEALNASDPAGRFLVYSTDPGEDTRGGLNADFTFFDKTFAGNPPGSISETGNGFLYSAAPPPQESSADIDLPSSFEQRRNGIGLNMGFDDNTSSPSPETYTVTYSDSDVTAPQLTGFNTSREYIEQDVLISGLNIRITPALARKMNWSLADIQNIFGSGNSGTQ